MMKNEYEQFPPIEGNHSTDMVIGAFFIAFLVIVSIVSVFLFDVNEEFARSECTNDLDCQSLFESGY